MYTWRSLLLIWCICTLSFLSSAAAQGILPGLKNPLPQPTVWLVSKTLQAHTTLLVIAVQVPENHHGYLDAGEEGFYIPLSFSFPTLEASGTRILPVSRPEGSRDELARATVLRGYGEYGFHIAAQDASPLLHSPLPTLFRYQICNDVTKICYPPQELALQLSSPLETSSRPALTTPPGVESRQPGARLTLNERLHALFKSNAGNLGLAFTLVVAAGLLASATPCVYPMLPITAAIFTTRGQGSWRRGQLHALVYFLGLICFYALMGLLATTTGTILSVVMTSAWVHLSFAFLFMYLGLSMIGLCEFQFLPALLAKVEEMSSQWQGFIGTLCMGATAGLVVSPCIGPITGTILLDIAGYSAHANAAGMSTYPPDMLFRGVFLMSGFGLGLGLPFLCISLLSSRLPHSGRWLTKTKYILALPTLYFAYSYYIKGMETAAVPLPVAHAILIGMLTIGAAVFIGVFHPLGANPSLTLRLKRTVGITLLTIGIYFLYNGLGQSGLLLNEPHFIPASANLSSTSPERVEVHANLHWLRELSTAQQRAKAEQKPVFVDFYATWCANCKAFQQLAVSDPHLNAALQQAILVKIYDTDPVFRTLQQEPHYPELRGIGGQPLLPLFAIYSPQGALTWKGQDFQAVSTIIAQLDHARGRKIP